MDTKTNIKNFYDAQAKNFSLSRKKPWKEFYNILQEIRKYQKDSINILELGCGDWRLLDYLKQHLEKQINFTWVDISENMIKLAKEKNPGHTFWAMDMQNFVEEEQQQKYDVIIMVASFQHIPNKQERLIILKNCYKSLNYEWKLIMVNWAFTKWFKKKYRKQIILSLLKSLIGLNQINDIYIPWKDPENNTTYQRYYHIFSGEELNKLLKLAWLIPKSIEFNERNSITIAEKNVIYN